MTVKNIQIERHFVVEEISTLDAVITITLILKILICHSLKDGIKLVDLTKAIIIIHMVQVQFLKKFHSLRRALSNQHVKLIRKRQNKLPNEVT